MAVAITIEQGKPIAQSRPESSEAANHRVRCTGRARYLRPSDPSGPSICHSVLRLPIGVIAAFSPWNFPMSSPARKVGGALSAECSIILKASEPGGRGPARAGISRCGIAARRAPALSSCFLGAIGIEIGRLNRPQRQGAHEIGHTTCAHDAEGGWEVSEVWWARQGSNL